MKYLMVCFIAWLSSLPLTSKALVEARVSYGLGNSTVISVQDVCNACLAQTGMDRNFSGIGADGIIQIPVSYFPALGIRYESLGSHSQSNELDLNISYNRTAFLMQWRPIDDTFYFGPILTYGLFHTLNSKARELETEKSNINSKSAESYSVGVEAGFKMVGFLLGAEIGYNELQWENAKDASGNQRDIDLSGAYGKLILGFSI